MSHSFKSLLVNKNQGHEWKRPPKILRRHDEIRHGVVGPIPSVGMQHPTGLTIVATGCWTDWMYGKCAPLLSGISIEKIVGLLGLLYFDWGKVDGHCDLGVSLKFDVRGFFSGGIPFTYRWFFFCSFTKLFLFWFFHISPGNFWGITFEHKFSSP